MIYLSFLLWFLTLDIIPPTPQLPGPKTIGQSFSLFLQTQRPCPVWLPLAPLLLETHYFSCSRNIKSQNCQRGGESPNNHRWQTWKFNLKSFFIIQNIKIKAIMPKGKHRLKPPMFHSLFLRGSPKHWVRMLLKRKQGCWSKEPAVDHWAKRSVTDPISFPSSQTPTVSYAINDCPGKLKCIKSSQASLNDKARNSHRYLIPGIYIMILLG